MKVILLKELKGRGGEGDVIDVAAGYANNYLLTQGYAIKATAGNLKQLEQRKHNIAKREATRLSDAEALRAKLDGATIKVLAKVGEEGALFGSITSSIIADAIKENLGAEVDRRRIELGNPIKVAGEHSVAVSIYRDIKAVVTVNVVSDKAPEVEEAEEAVEAEAPAAEETEEAAE